MEKKLVNAELNEEALEEVSGGIIPTAPDLGIARYATLTQQNYDFDVAQNLILDDMTNPALGVQANAAQIGLVQEVAKNIF